MTIAENMIRREPYDEQVERLFAKIKPDLHRLNDVQVALLAGRIVALFKPSQKAFEALWLTIRGERVKNNTLEPESEVADAA